MQILSIIYSLHFENVKIHKHCLYWKVFSTDIYRKIYFNSLLLFSYICWSVNCMSWVRKFNNFILHVWKLMQDLYLRALILSFMESLFLTLQYFFCFFHLVYKFFKGLFQLLCQSANCMLSLWIIEHTSEMSSNVSINLDLRLCSIAIYGKFYFYCLYHLRLFSGL